MSNGKWAILTALFLWNMANGYCQNLDGENIFPKGEYVHVSTTTKQVSYSETLYEADAAIINDTWQNNGFRLEDEAFTTGVYGTNQSFRAISPSFGLPLQREGTRIYIKIDSKLHSESYNDEACLRMRNTKTGESYTLYSASGIGERATEYIDISHYSGYTVQLELSFTSDSTYNGDGWSIYSVSIVGDHLFQNRNLRNLPSSLRMTRDFDGNSIKRNEPKNSYLQNMRVDIIDVTPKDEYRGTVSFTLTDTVDITRKFIPLENISANDFLIKVAGKEANICSALRGSQNDKLDVIYAVDCSGSMSSMQVLLDSVDKRLTKGIDGEFDALFAEVTFGEYSDGCYGWEWFDFDFSSLFSLQYRDDKGGQELYYHVLNEITKHDFKRHRMDAQKAIIMIGDEACNGGNQKDCNGNDLSQDSVAQNLRTEGYQTIIINRKNYDGYFNTITQKTKGKYVGAKGSTLGFGVDSVVQFLVSNLKYRYFLDYCLDTTYRCDTIIDVSLKIKDTDVMDSTQTNIEYMPIITRDSATIAYDEHGYHCGNDILIAFRVSNYCENDQVDTARVIFSVNGGISFDTIIAQKMDSLYVAYIQQDSIPDGTRKIDYRISVQMQNGRFIATSPQVTNTVGDTWTIPVCCSDNCIPLPSVMNVTWNCNSVIQVAVRNAQNLDNLQVYFLYNNEFKENVSAAQYTYVPLQLTNYTDNGDKRVYSAAVPDDIQNKHIVYHIYMTDGNYKMWYGNGNETNKDMEVDVENCNPLCENFRLSSNPITSSSDSVCFTLKKQTMIKFVLTDDQGKLIRQKEIMETQENVEIKHSLLKEVFDDLNPRELDPLKPYILTITDGKKAVMTYLYVSRL
ncbi:MAG: VWA domain-containing protein [Paludibacteraceae bacterium]|nr:VWA domain-containing protein [Paludibacteraceae bacterium]